MPTLAVYEEATEEDLTLKPTLAALPTERAVLGSVVNISGNFFLYAPLTVLTTLLTILFDLGMH
ncbi:UNVERIFIED_CONTAM: hypothetical protein FKN15_021350 [Acipenser sinensis]